MATPVLDHAIYVCADLDATADRLLRNHGLASRVGGRHPGHGTGNRIVPLGDAYLELMTLVDPDEARDSALGRAVARRLAAGDGWFALCLGTDDIEAEALRLGTAPLAMQRVTPSGRPLSWRLAGLDEALAEAPVPFFIQWDIPRELHPGRQAARHHARPTGLRRVWFGGDPTRVEDRTGGPVGGLVVDPTRPPGPSRVEIGTQGGGLILGPDLEAVPASDST